MLIDDAHEYDEIKNIAISLHNFAKMHNTFFLNFKINQVIYIILTRNKFAWNFQNKRFKKN